jgi:hypothetical protein
MSTHTQTFGPTTGDMIAVRWTAQERILLAMLAHQDTTREESQDRHQLLLLFLKDQVVNHSAEVSTKFALVRLVVKAVTGVLR